MGLPRFDRLREIVESFGDDITVEGRATYTRSFGVGSLRPWLRRRRLAPTRIPGGDKVEVMTTQSAQLTITAYGREQNTKPTAKGAPHLPRG